MNTPATEASDRIAQDFCDAMKRKYGYDPAQWGDRFMSGRDVDRLEGFRLAREIDAAPAAAVGGAMRYKTPEELANGDSRIPIPAGGFVLSEKDNEWWWQRTDHMNPEARNRVRELLRSMQKITTAQPSAKDGVRVEAWLIERLDSENEPYAPRRSVVDHAKYNASSDAFWTSKEVKAAHKITPLVASNPGAQGTEATTAAPVVECESCGRREPLQPEEYSEALNTLAEFNPGPDEYTNALNTLRMHQPPAGGFVVVPKRCEYPKPDESGNDTGPCCAHAYADGWNQCLDAITTAQPSAKDGVRE